MIATNEKTQKFFKINEEKLPNQLDEIIDIPKAKDANNKTKLAKILAQTKTFTREAFTKLLQNCHNIIRNNDKLDPAVAFDEISKILFIKIRYERNPDEDTLFSQAHFNNKQKDYEKNIKPHLQAVDQIDYMQFLFRQTKSEFAKDDLFDTNDTIRIKQHSFEQIVKALEAYNLSDTSDDIKGIAFEQFLGRTFRGELGQFFTPRPLVDFMVEILDPVEGETICDPCCGSGGFLIKAFEYLREQIEHDIQQQKTNIKKKYLTKNKTDQANQLISELNQELNLKNPQGRLHQLSLSAIFGTDANPRMARTAKMNMIMHGDGHSGLHHNDGLLNVNGIFEGRFDVILTNPPFGARVDKTIKISESDQFKDQAKINHYTTCYGIHYTNALKQISDNLNKPLLSLFNVGKFSTLTEVLFMERCLKLLKKGGRMGIVFPEGVLNNTNLQKVRDYFEGKAKILLITSIPQDVFISTKATVKPSLVFFKKFSEVEQRQYNAAYTQSEQAVKAQYKNQIEAIKNSSAPKKEQNKQLKALQTTILTETKKRLKNTLNYPIPIAQAKHAGITTTGEPCDNDLIEIAKDFKKYRTAQPLWESPAAQTDEKNTPC